MKLPQFVMDVLSRFEGDVGPVMEVEVFEALNSARRSQGDLTEEDFEGFRAEASAFFFDSRRDEDSPWGTYFAPTFTGIKADKTEVRSPDIAELSAEVVAHWEMRADTTPHPVFRARYADLVWDLKRNITGGRPDVGFARTAIDSYVAAVESSLYSMEAIGIEYCERALDLSCKIADNDRKKAVVDLMFRLYDRFAEPQHIGSWVFLFDNLYGRKDLISEQQEAEIVKKLEAMLAIVANKEDNASFNPWGAEAASERLAKHYSRTKSDGEIKRVTATYGSAFEGLAKDASSLLAMAWLQPVYEKYQQMGMKADAERVQLVSLEKAKTIESEMKTVSVRLEIKKEDIEELNNVLIAGGLKESLVRLARNFIPTVQNVKGFLDGMKQKAPLRSLIGVTSIADGHFVAKAGSTDEDQEGRLYMQLAENIQFAQPFLGSAIEALQEKYSPTSSQILDFLYDSPVFDSSRRSLIQDGIDAYFAGDYVKAVHTLIPQIENALRGLLPLLDIPLNKQFRGWSGVMQVKSLNDILQDPRVRLFLGEDYHKYLDVFLADPRGHNIRNRVAHGLVNYEELRRPLADQVFHVMLTIGLLTPKPIENEEDTHE